MARWKRAPQSVFHVLLALALTISIASSQAADGVVQRADFEVSPDAADSALRQVVYTTGDRGGKLAWLPYRPDQAPRRIPSAQPNAGPTLAPPAQLTSNASGQAPVRPAVLTPMSDPFGDRLSVAQHPLLTEPLNDRVLERSTAGEDPPRLDGVLPGDMANPPDIEQRIAQGPPPAAVDCRPASEVLTDIHSIDPDISKVEGKDIPRENLPPECPLGYQQPQRQDWYLHRSWAPTTFHWKASGLCHKPTYFEDVQLERYGHSWGPYLQPLASGAHFFLTVPVLPYKMGLYPPNECIYTLGYYRSGSCAPYLLDPIPLSARAAVAQAGAVVGAAAFLP